MQLYAIHRLTNVTKDCYMYITFTLGNSLYDIMKLMAQQAEREYTCTNYLPVFLSSPPPLHMAPLSADLHEQRL